LIEFDLEPELELLRQTARSFAEEQLRPRDREFESARRVGPEAHAAFRQIGLAALEVPEALGGAGLGAVARAIVSEELAAADAGAALALDPLGPALYPLLELGAEPALRTIAGPLLERDGARAVLAWNGEARLSLAAGRASGVLPWLPADRVDALVVLDADSAFAVERGVVCVPVRGAGLRAAGASEVRLDRAPVAAGWVDPRRARRALARARLYAAGLLVGVMRSAADYAREYAMQRIAFGRPIAHHQALAFLIADMQSAVEGSRLLLHEAAARVDRGEDPEAAHEACATAFLEATEQAMFVTPNAVQILGGHGFMQDYPVEKWMREARALGLLLGGVDAARRDAGQDLPGAVEPLALAAAPGMRP
jgi:acyl-CoA dehydrogenase